MTLHKSSDIYLPFCVHKTFGNSATLINAQLERVRERTRYYCIISTVYKAYTLLLDHLHSIQMRSPNIYRTAAYLVRFSSLFSRQRAAARCNVDPEGLTGPTVALGPTPLYISLILGTRSSPKCSLMHDVTLIRRQKTMGPRRSRS
jgi:hypothetical protein